MSINSLADKYHINENTDKDTDNYVFNHTMIRVKNLENSIHFYTNIMGFVPVYEGRFEEAAFTIVYLVRRSITDIPENDEERKEWVLKQSGVLELIHNHGTEEKPEFSYHNGNTEPRGFGHLCITVPDLRLACERFESLGVKFIKRLNEGRMSYVAFVEDPDNYWIEILQPTPLK